jgi:DNA-binding transcriptional LysR family regulator
MRAFVRVVEAGSFTKAADTLNMSRATVTQLIQQLEAHLQIKLLNRTTRRVNVTTDGAAFYERVVGLLNELSDIENNLPGASSSPRGVLRVDVPSPFANIVLVPALPHFFDRFPDIQLKLGASDRIARHIGDLRLGVYAAPSYLDKFGTPLHPTDLRGSNHRIVRYRWSNEFPYSMHKDGESHGINGHMGVEIDDGNAYLTAGLVGLGVQWLPEYMAKKHLENGALVQLFKDWNFEPMPLYVAYSPNRYASKQLRVFIEWVTELMAEHVHCKM